MISARWRTLSVVLGAVCVVLLWRNGNHAPADPRAVPDCPEPRSDRTASAATADPADPPRHPALSSGEQANEQAGDGITLYGFKVPSWVIWLAPHPGEDLRSYRDRMLPIAVATIAPQRARVARSRDSFAALANLDPRQRDELDAATQETATALQDRIMSAVLGGELSPSMFKPMTGVALARDLLEIVGQGHRRFLDSLRVDQRFALARHPFDFGDYLVFSTHWEDALKLL